MTYLNFQAYFITNMEPMNMWDFTYLVQEELGYKRCSFYGYMLTSVKHSYFIVQFTKYLFNVHLDSFHPFLFVPFYSKFHIYCIGRLSQVVIHLENCSYFIVILIVHRMQNITYNSTISHLWKPNYLFHALVYNIGI